MSTTTPPADVTTGSTAEQPVGRPEQHGSPTEHVDVLVVGAGISGIGAARYLAVEHPHRTVVVLEGRERPGGTWDLFRYPGIRSDSDLHTFGYEFKPWRDEESIAGAPQILRYLEETMAENGIAEKVRYRHRVVSADWSSDDARWTVTVERGDTGERFAMTAGWVFAGTGYYDYEQGFSPVFEGRDRFAGELVHPQHWPEDLEVAGKRVVVIGSGATAVTLVPALADLGADVTMLQRTPTYVLPVPRVDAIAVALQKWLGPARGYALARRKNIAQQRLVWQLCQRFPGPARKVIRWVNTKQLPDGFDVDTHFNPPYDPWDQRLCAVPDGDLFKAIRAGKAHVVTDRITTFTETGLQLEGGEHLDADVVVTATGLNLQLFGGIELAVDGKPVVPSETVVHRGTMLTGVPNFSIAIGYTNSSWTLKVGILCEYLCQLLRHLDEHGLDTAWVEADPDMALRPLLDFGAGYVQRSLADLPKQGPEAPWVMSMDYQADRKLLSGPLVSEGLHFSGPADRAASPGVAQRSSSTVSLVEGNFSG
ncbi:flavin-containing monooxygenase [Nocardioides perillae]|uniref:Cation diffusion facilitator CzcD-associated flavoprotein CzcO n=1 Tax=Nocardioides perillae TaxID=1119534 RepID=A0A7Y9RVG5_9ACTN|nr:NAD(P)/FAD-dependent oxidoreductase [Nocardioides perillae]NYG55367.1 cation diffusion facilitator CzcD-associated flavoprotein CzcO [Nocardioides perillae]